MVFVTALLGTWWARRYALRRRLIDAPGARRSHVVATPRGGGIAIVAALVPVFVWLASQDASGGGLAFCAASGLVLVAGIGWLDDHRPLSALVRLAVHIVAATLLAIGMASAGAALWWCLCVWILAVGLVNVWNFMDGIDGLASVEALTVCVGAAVIYALLGFSAHSLVPVLLTAAVAGFLVWNFPPASIFMGDTGSGFLGLVIGALAIQAAWLSPKLLWCWCILLGVFIVDATWTLIRRLLRGVKVYEAHRSHAYQIASRRLGAHLPVTLLVLVVNLLWLLPIALAVAFDWIDGLGGLVLAYAPLIWVVVWLNAGGPEQTGVGG